MEQRPESLYIWLFTGQLIFKNVLYLYYISGTTLQDLTEAALEEIERQEAAMEGLDGTEPISGSSVIHEISSGMIKEMG